MWCRCAGTPQDNTAGAGATLTTDCVRSISPVTVFFSSMSLAGASVNRKNSELEGAFARPSCKGRRGKSRKRRKRRGW